MLPLRMRLPAVVALVAGAPICAEYLQAYMGSTGDVAQMAGGLLVLGPLYGGAALVIREVAVSTHRGWPGIVLMATAFGLLMTGVIDLSLVGEYRSDVEGWRELREPTLVGAWGVSVAPLVGWVSGHVLMSVGVPLMVLYAAAPRLRGARLVGRWGLLATVVLFSLAALAIRMDARRVYEPDPAPSAWQYGAVAAAVALALGAAFTRWGAAPSQRPGRRVWSPRAVFVATVVVSLAYGLTDYSWWGVAVTVAALTGAAWGLGAVARSPGWGPRHVAAVAGAALVARTAIGLLAPVPPGVAAVAKYGQNAVLLAAVVAVAWWIARRTAAEPEPRAGGAEAATGAARAPAGAR